MKTATLVSGLFFFLLLSACEAEQDPLMPVGAKVPGGFTVDESQKFETMAACIAHAKESLKKREAVLQTDTTTTILYATAFYTEDQEGVQVCQVRRANAVLYSSAIK